MESHLEWYLTTRKCFQTLGWNQNELNSILCRLHGNKKIFIDPTNVQPLIIDETNILIFFCRHGEICGVFFCRVNDCTKFEVQSPYIESDFICQHYRGCKIEIIEVWNLYTSIQRSIQLWEEKKFKTFILVNNSLLNVHQNDKIIFTLVWVRVIA